MSSLFRPIELVNVQTLPLDKVETISISYIAESVTVLETDGDALILKEYYSEDDPDLFARITNEDGALIIRRGQLRRLFNAVRGYVEVFLPRQFFGVLNLKSVSGKIESGMRLVLSELNVSNTSGRIALRDVTAGSAVLSTVSGSVEVGRLKAMASVHSTSGAVRVGSAEGDGTYRTVSGSIDAAYHAVTGDIEMNSTSGRLRLCVPSLLSFSLEAHSVSGSIHIPFRGTLAGGRHNLAGTVGQSPQVRVRLRTVSGRIEMQPVQ